VKAGDMVRIRKSHPAVQRWRKRYRTYGSPFIGKWAEEGASLLILEECGLFGGLAWWVLGPGGQFASFDDYLLIRSGARNESR